MRERRVKAMSKFEEEYTEERMYRQIIAEQWLNRAIINKWPIAKYYHEYAVAKSEAERALGLSREEG